MAAVFAAAVTIPLWFPGYLGISLIIGGEKLGEYITNPWLAAAFFGAAVMDPRRLYIRREYAECRCHKKYNQREGFISHPIPPMNSDPVQYTLLYNNSCRILQKISYINLNALSCG